MALAATRLIALHKNKGMTVAACLKNRTDYIENPDKTEQGQFVSSYACSTLTADEEFMLTKRQYDLVNGRRQKSDVIAYQIRQSFRPGEITAEEANKVGYELAMRFTKGKYAFVVATHTDRQHIHNHVIFNSTALDGTRKFRDFFFSALAVQRLSDLICLEHQLSVIEKKPYRERQKRTLYESFIRVVDSMVAQHAKWLKVCNQLPWRQSIASLNLILSSNVWQQDHNGYTHQDPGFLDHIANKKADVVRLYLPPDTNCLLSCFDHCIRSRDYVNVLVTSKHPRPQWLTMEQAVKHCTQGVGIWDWASTDAGEEPDIVMACCGDTPTLETLAAVTILRDALPELKIRVVNVVDLMKLEPNTKHPHGLSDADYNALFTKDKPIIFAFHGYPTLVHELTYERANRNLSVHGYQEEGTITTPFDMRVQNEIDRFHLVKDAVLHLPQLGNRGAYLVQQMNDKLVEHKNYIHEVGQDMPEILDWKWHI